MTGRVQAVREVLAQSQKRGEHVVIAPDPSIIKYYGCNVFNDEAMQKYMSKADYASVKDCVAKGRRLTNVEAERVAEAMRRWAVDRGVTHYAHWFQPWTGKTAEKHDSLFTLDMKTGAAIEEFSGGQLTQGEPDGSSFPGGGLRSTFEARGYTAWDPSSPAFVMEVGATGSTLCIPSTFITYGGHAMDFKLPLLRSNTYVNKAAVKVCQLFDKQVTRVVTTLGWEQEYFVIDAAFFAMRPDLVMCGRTLLGKAPPRGQQLEDHYFCSIPERVFAFMKDLEIESHKLGIPLRTRHNEVAPSQFEAAPMFEEVSVAADHNLLLMDLMERIAKRHQLAVLLHEKPFAGINGSGKHHNFSLATNTGKNLLNPGAVPVRNLQFLIFFICIIKAVYAHGDILRAALAYAANDHRLGANEAPPAIISVFVGSALAELLQKIEQGEWKSVSAQPELLHLAEVIPNVTKDATDRNRTSPFAFTGNKFEIRMPGSSMNCAGPMTVMNTMLGKQLMDFTVDLETATANGTAQDTAIMQILQRYIRESSAVLFEGDNYSDQWRLEAARRGLPIKNTTPEALEAFVTDKAKRLFSESGVYTLEELHGFYDVKLDNYYLTVQIESRTMGEMIVNHIIPSALEYQTKLAANVASLRAVGMPEGYTTTQMELIEQIATTVAALYKGVDQMSECRKVANAMGSVERAWAYMKTVKPLLDALRADADKLEYLVPDKDWPLIKYREMLFIR